MTAQGFGRKSGPGGAVAPRRTSLVASQQPRSFQPMKAEPDSDEEIAQRRAAFLAAERARGGGPAETVTLPTAETETALARLKAERAPPPTDRSLKAAYAIWFLLGLAGGHRFYLRRPLTGALQALLFLACLGAVALFQYYEAFAGLAVSWLWFLADGIHLKRLHLWSGRE